MDYESIRQLISDMDASKLTSLEIELPDGSKIKMTKETAKQLVSNVEVNEYKSINERKDETEEKANITESKSIIYSPMVGTFYAKPTPTSEQYVDVGKKVKKGDILCIIEAMKLMNEIESEYDGEIVEVFVKDGESVEYGQPLFEIA